MPLVIRENPPVFPYGILWPELGTSKVRFADLAAETKTYETLFDVLRSLEIATPYVDREILRTVVEPLQLSADAAARLIDEAFLVAGWYLEPKQREALGGDLASTRRNLREVAGLARKLDGALSRLSPKACVAMTLIRSLEPEAMDPDEQLSTLTLSRTLHDLALVSERVSMDTAPAGAGRKSDYVRNAALGLLIAATERATGEVVKTSQGTRDNPDPHFVGQGGDFIRSLFHLVAAEIPERILVQTARRMRRMGKP